MLQKLDEEVYVEVRQDTVARAPGTKRAAALQYVVQNRGLRRVTVRLDFARSHHVELVFPEENDQLPAENELSSSSKAIDVTVGPLQRRHVVHVVRANGERAYVRVEYAVLASEEVKRNENGSQVQQMITQSTATYGDVAIPTTPDGGNPLTATELLAWCVDVNRWSRQTRVTFVDPTFSPTETALWGRAGADQTKHSNATASITWMHLSHIVDASWRFVDKKKSPQETSATWSSGCGVIDQDNWVCAIDALHGDAAGWCEEWFGARSLEQLTKCVPRLRERSVVGVKLCWLGREWVWAMVDLFAPVITDGENQRGGLVCAWPHTGEIYAVLVQKAYAKLCGSYAEIARVSTRRILQDLTGRPIVQAYPNGTWEGAGGVVAKIAASLSSGLAHGKLPPKRPLLMVSFGAFDDHHCAFQLVGVEQSVPGSSLGLRLRDPSNTFHSVIAAKLQIKFKVDEEESTCVVPESEFVRLTPTVFEVLVNHSFTQHRRKVFMRRDQKCSFQVALSCASLQSVVVRCYARRLSNATCDDAVSLVVDRVADDDKWTRLDLTVQTAQANESPSTQAHWTALAGEYVVTFSVDPCRNPGPATTISSANNVPQTLDILFRALDQDMDGLISNTDLVDFLQANEGMVLPESFHLADVVDRFVQKYAVGMATPAGLTKDELLQVYEDVAIAQERSLPTKKGLDNRLATLIWNDLLHVLANSHDENSPPTLSLDDVYELYCVVSSDRNDNELVLLSE